MTKVIKQYDIEQEIAYHKKLMKRKSFHAQIKAHYQELHDMARSLGVQMEISSEDWTYHFNYFKR